METALYLSLSQTITYSFNGMQSTQTKLGAYPHKLLPKHTKIEKAENMRKINKEREPVASPTMSN